MPNVKLNSLPEDFPISSFAPGVWVEYAGRQLIAVPDKEANEWCIGCIFTPGDGPNTPSRCTLRRSENEHRVCSSALVGRAFDSTVRIIDEPTYAKLRIKGKL